MPGGAAAAARLALRRRAAMPEAGWRYPARAPRVTAW